MAASVHSLNSNEYYILFSPFELLHAIAKSCQINWGIERIMWFNLLLQIYYKKKLVVGNSAIREVNGLNKLNVRLRFFECTLFTFIP